MKVAVVQIPPVAGDTRATIDRVAEYVRKAAEQGAELVAFPECFLTGGSFEDRDSLLARAVDIGRGDLAPILEAAAATKIHVVVGFYQTAEGEALNTAALIGPDGIIGLHHKRHLPFMIGDRFVDVPKGTEVPVFETPVGKIGLAICYEIRFPEVTRTLALEGADIVVLPAAWPIQARMLPDIFSRVRAAENFVYFVSANRNDLDGDMQFMGMSHVIGPDGNEIVNAGESDGIVIADIDVTIARNKSIIREPGVYEIHPFRDRLPDTYRN